MKVKAAFYILIFTIFFSGGVFALDGNQPVSQADLVLQEEARHLYRVVPDVPVQTLALNNSIREFQLSELWRDQPLLITLFYKECTGSCSPFLRSLDDAVKKTGGLGSDYKILSLSFDPRDTAKSVSQFSKSLGIEDNGKWIMGVSTPEAIQQLTKNIGFWYKIDGSTKQYEHPTMIAAVRAGKIIRVLMGANVSKQRFKEMVWELQGKFVPFYTRPGEKTIFRCLQLNERTQEVNLNWGLLILILPGTLALLTAYLLFKGTRYLF